MLAASGAVLAAALAAGAGGRALSSRRGAVAPVLAEKGTTATGAALPQPEPAVPQPAPAVPLPAPPAFAEPVKEDPGPTPAALAGIAAGNLGTIGKRGAPRPTLKLKGKLARRMKVLEALAEKAAAAQPLAGAAGGSGAKAPALKGPRPKVADIGDGDRRQPPEAKTEAKTKAPAPFPGARKTLPGNADFEEVEGLVKEAVPPVRNQFPDAATGQPAPARRSKTDLPPDSRK